MQYKAPEVPPMFTSKSSTRELSVVGRSARSAEGAEMKDRTCFAPSRSVKPQSPSPTMVSYSVIVASEAITLLQPPVMILRMRGDEKVMDEVPSLGDGVEMLDGWAGMVAGLV